MPGDVIAYALPNDADPVLWQLACQEGGYRSISLNPSSLRQEVKRSRGPLWRCRGGHPQGLRGPCGRPRGDRLDLAACRGRWSDRRLHAPTSPWWRASPETAPARTAASGCRSPTPRAPRASRRPSSGPGRRRSTPPRPSRTTASLRPGLPVPALHRRAPGVGGHAPRRLPVLLHRGAERGQGLAILGKFDPEGALGGSSSAPGHDGLHGADPVRPAPPPAPGAEGPLDVSSLEVVVHSAAPCPLEVKQADDGLVGPRHLGDLRRHGGRGHDRQALPLAGEAGHGGAVGGRHDGEDPRRRRERALRTETAATSTSSPSRAPPSPTRTTPS